MPTPATEQTSGTLSADTPQTDAVHQLTPEEQMERFAKELKNEDWGHQPC